MMEKLQHDIFDLIDGLLPIQKRKEIEIFLESNQEAADFYQEMKSLGNRLGSLQVVKTSPDFDSDLRARIRMEKRLGRSDWIPEYVRIPALAFAGAAAVLVLFLTFGPKLGNFSQYEPGTPVGVQNTQDTQQTFYPLERIVSNNGGGTNVNSEGLQRAASQLDSMRSADKFERRIQSVEF